MWFEQQVILLSLTCISCDRPSSQVLSFGPVLCGQVHVCPDCLGRYWCVVWIAYSFKKRYMPRKVCTHKKYCLFCSSVLSSIDPKRKRLSGGFLFWLHANCAYACMSWGCWFPSGPPWCSLPSICGAGCAQACRVGTPTSADCCKLLGSAVVLCFLNIPGQWLISWLQQPLGALGEQESLAPGIFPSLGQRVSNV